MIDLKTEVAEALTLNSSLLEVASPEVAFRLGYIAGRGAGIDAAIQDTHAMIKRLAPTESTGTAADIAA